MFTINKYFFLYCVAGLRFDSVLQPELIPCRHALSGSDVHGQKRDEGSLKNTTRK